MIAPMINKYEKTNKPKMNSAMNTTIPMTGAMPAQIRLIASVIVRASYYLIYLIYKALWPNFNSYFSAA